MADSTVPAAIDALVALFTAALTDVSVHDGPAVAASYPDHLSVAWDGDNPEVVTTDVSPADIRGGSPSFNEVFIVRCVISGASGDMLMKTRRDRAFAIFAACKTALRGDMKLGGAVTTAWVSDFGLIQDSSKEDGIAAAIRFGIRCKSRI